MTALIATAIPGPLLIAPEVIADERGFFYESWNARAFAAAGLDVAFVQDNHSRSAKGVLRGIHFQNPDPQGKLVRVVTGAIWDVAVDLRRSSPHFGRWVGVELGAADRRSFWVPPGFGHGFLSLADGTDVLYKCTTDYAPATQQALAWDDPALGIAWPLGGAAPLLSAKDAAARSLAEIEPFA